MMTVQDLRDLEVKALDNKEYKRASMYRKMIDARSKK